MSGKQKRGITITEALASIAVASVGLFAVLAVIPFAARQAQVGLDLDYAVAVGKNGFHDFDNREMGVVRNWRIGYDEAPTQAFDYDLDGNDEFFGGNGTANTNNFLRYGKVVLIDPLFLNRNSDLFPTEFAIDQFPMPLYDPTDPDPDDVYPATDINGAPSGLPAKTSETINRLNLVSVSRKGNKAGWTDIKFVPYFLPMSELVFQDSNDLQFEEAIDKLNPPNQIYKLGDPTLSKNDPANPRVKRQSTGKISWMAMLVPEANHRHLYRVYFIVFKDRVLRFQRDPNISVAGNPSRNIIGEVVFDARVPNPVAVGATFQRGQGGGEFSLDWRAGAFPIDDANNVLTGGAQKTLNQGDWILLANKNQNFYRWYQISRIDNTRAVGAPDCDVTLRGPDVDANAINAELRAIAPAGVIAVYEKTIRIESDSIWNN